MEAIAIRRLRVLPLPHGAGIPTKGRLAVLAELAALGYRLRNPKLLDAAASSWLSGHKARIAELKALRGGDVDYVHLFLKFPGGIPKDDAHFAKRILGYVGNLSGAFEGCEDGERLENGVFVPHWLFDLQEFGADPITQLQSPSLFERAKAKLRKRKAASHVEWIDLDLVWQDELEARLLTYLHDHLYAKSSIKEALHDDIKALILHFDDRAGIDADRISQSETKALLLAAYWGAGKTQAVAALARSPTDLLRMFACLTGTDISLATKARFPKLRRAQRRALLGMLERCPNLAEDLLRHRGLWLALGRSLHVGEYSRSHAKTAAAFDALRRNTIITYESDTERLLANHDLKGVLEHLGQRPGLLGRRLHELLRRFKTPPESAAIFTAFNRAAKKIPTKALLVLDTYFATINESEYRAVINKRGKLKMLANNAYGALNPEIAETARTLAREALLSRFRARGALPGKRIWIDPMLTNYTVPLQQRAASDGILPFGRGSRVPVDFGKVLRLFIYWRQQEWCTDLDLSVIQFNADLKYAGHVSYTNLSSTGIVHSGDIVSAPKGAAEFIDITLCALPPEVRYLAVEVNRFAGEEFAVMRCHAGWMIREEVDASLKTFDIKAVANKINLNGTGAYAVPLVVDLERNEIILSDLYMGGKSMHNSVEGNYGNVALACQALREFTSTRPSMLQLAELHLQARGGVRVDDAALADVTFGIQGCTYNATESAKILAELL